MLKKHSRLSRLSRRLFVSRVVLPGVVFALAAGCGGGGGSDTSSATRQTVERVQGPFRITASIPKRTYRKGEAVEITFTVTNTSADDLLIDWRSARSATGLDFGKRLAQFSVKQGEKRVFDSLPSTDMPFDELIRAGGRWQATVNWRQSDLSPYFNLPNPYTGPEPSYLLAPNTAAPGEYQIVPRLNSPGYSKYIELPGYSGPDLEAGGFPLSDEQQNQLPPLTVTIVP